MDYSQNIKLGDAMKKMNFKLKPLHPDFVQSLDSKLRTEKREFKRTDYIFAMRCGIHPSILSLMLNRAKLFRSDSKTVKRVAAAIGYRGSLFESEPKQQAVG